MSSSQGITSVAITAAYPTLYRQLLDNTDLDTLDRTEVLTLGEWPTSGKPPTEEIYVANASWEGATSPFTDVASTPSSGGEGAAANATQRQERRITMPLVWSNNAVRDKLDQVLQQPSLQVVFRRSDSARTNDRRLIRASYLTDRQIPAAVFDGQMAVGGLLFRSDFPWFVGERSTTNLGTSYTAVSMPSQSGGPMLYAISMDKPIATNVKITIQDTAYGSYDSDRGKTWEWNWDLDSVSDVPAGADKIFFVPAANLGGIHYHDTSTASGTIDGNPVIEGSFNGVLLPYLKNWRSYRIKIVGARGTLYCWRSHLRF